MLHPQSNLRSNMDIPMKKLNKRMKKKEKKKQEGGGVSGWGYVYKNESRWREIGVRSVFGIICFVLVVAITVLIIKGASIVDSSRDSLFRMHPILMSISFFLLTLGTFDPHVSIEKKETN